MRGIEDKEKRREKKRKRENEINSWVSPRNWNQIPAQGSKMKAIAKKCNRRIRLTTGRHARAIRSRWNISPPVTRRPPKQKINSFETPSKGIFDMIPWSDQAGTARIVFPEPDLPKAFYRMKLASAVPTRGSVTDHGQFGLYNIGKHP